MPESNIYSSLSAALPNELTFSIKLDAGSDPDASYLDITVKDVPGTENVFEGMTFDGYCIDTDRGIRQNIDYTAKVYSSYETLPDELIGTGLIEKPENFDQVNWILNQGFEGQASTGNGTYTSGDIQRAVWSLLDDQQSNGGGTLGAWEQARVDEILDLAQNNGEGFVPEYDYTTIFGEQVVGKMGVILVPDSNDDGLPDSQIVIAEVELSKIGDKVWSDCDADGIQDGNEAGMAGVTVNLLADIDGDGVIEDGEVVDTTTTDANGNYEFTAIAGDYKVQFEQPDNKLLSPTNQGGDDTVDSDGLLSDVVTLSPGENDTTVDAGFYHPPSFKAALPGMLTFSIKLDAGSDPDASYVDITIKDIPGTDNPFEGMTFDGYCLDTDRPINQNVDYTAKVYSSGEPLPDELIGPGLIEKPENLDLVNWILNQNFEGKASTGNGTSYTSGDVQRAIWELIDDEQSGGGGSLGAWEQARVDEILSEAQSNGEGFVPSYDYTTIFGEQVIGKLGLILVPDTDGDCLPDKQIVIAEVELSKLGDTVWLDSDADGIQDAGEAGIAGVTVNLFADIDGDGVFEDSELVETTTTDANGNYDFSVMAGEYQVEFEQPDGYEVSPVDEGGDDTVDSDGLVSDIVSLAPGENDPTIDSGFYQLASLGDKVFEDTNGNGVQDAGENGIEDVLVKLQNPDGTAVLDGNDNPITTTTDANGEYSFTGLTPGEYKVMFVAPNGYEFTTQDAGGDDGLDSDANPSNGMTQTVTLESGEFNDTLDAGLIQPASLGDFVFEDTNGNGVQDAGENGIEDVLVKLQNPDGTAVVDGNGNPITTTTDANGEYEFTGLTPGEYKVMFVAPDGYIFSPQDAGGDDGLDSDANPSNGMTQTVTLESGEINDTLDAGLLIPNPGIDIEKFVNDIDVTDLSNLPEIAAGDDVTFTYEVTNTGNVGFSTSDVIVSDDNGTVGDTSDDFTPTLDLSTDFGSDGILSPGETWVYSSDTQAAQDLSTSTTSDIRFILTGSSSLDGTNGNVRTFTQDGVSVDVSAFSQKWGTWKDGYLGAYGGGLGVTNRDEWTSSHRVDNSGSTDYILFEFDQDVTVDKAFLDYVGWDSDMSIWIGDRDGADISQLNDSLLDSFTKENNFTHHGGDRWADFNDAGLTGDTVVISAYTDGSNDSFKLKKLDVSVTETSFGEYQNVATVQADTVSDSDTSGYVNPTDTASTPAHILIEAEDMHLNDYQTEHENFASGGELIKLSDHSGYASTTFDGETGTYDVIVGYYDENDGQANAKVKIDGDVLDYWTFDQDLASHVASPDNFVTRQVGNDVHIENGDSIKLFGWEDGNEYARFDYIKLVNTDAATNAAAADEITGTSGVDELVGTDADDTLVGYASWDLLTGGGGADKFVFTSLNDRRDKITDFEVGSDVIDMSQVLDAIGYVGNDPISDGYVQLGSNSYGAVVSVDQDGLGDDYDPVALVEMANVNVNSLSASHFIF